jgi:hypothetical protein
MSTAKTPVIKVAAVVISTDSEIPYVIRPIAAASKKKANGMAKIP